MGVRIPDYRKALVRKRVLMEGVSKADVARQLGISRYAVIEICNGVNYRQRRAEKQRGRRGPQ